ncbi:MAG: cysteine desulfurase [Firmicutes bacterium]|nr:cysteine desulfurase [Bacillota bacterium]
MIYLDYSATTPVSLEVLETMNRTTKEFIGNANSLNALGIKSKELLNSATKQIADLFSVLENEITYTSSATESNNMALIGVAMANFKKGKHIIVSKLEHPSIYAICDYLSSIGFEISYVNNDAEGLIDFDNLKSLIRPDTILVSVCAVNSEVGIRQPLKLIRQIIKKENSGTLLHSDMTQAIGKTSVTLHDVDLASISSHKIYGPKGIALLYKSNQVSIKPLIYGSGKSNELKPGTPALPLIAGFSKALRLSQADLEKKEKYISLLNDRLCKKFSSLPDVQINKTKYSIPHILNVSLLNIKPETFIHAMDSEGIYLSTNTACSSGELSSGVMAIFNDVKRSTHTIRISLSSQTTSEEITRFLEAFDKNYHMLNSLVVKD